MACGLWITSRHSTFGFWNRRTEMPSAIHHAGETAGNRARDELGQVEPRALRTYPPTQTVIARSAGVFHWTADGRRIYEFTEGVLVSNLGHNPVRWMERFTRYMGWPATSGRCETPAPESYLTALPMTAYNAATPVEIEASRRLVKFLRERRGGARMGQVMWAASGSEAIQKAIWAALARDRTRPMILASRFGFHGKKGLANAVTGSEAGTERDPRVRFISFPMAECRDVSLRDATFDPIPYQDELDALLNQ